MQPAIKFRRATDISVMEVPNTSEVGLVVTLAKDEQAPPGQRSEQLRLLIPSQSLFVLIRALQEAQQSLNEERERWGPEQ